MVPVLPDQILALTPAFVAAMSYDQVSVDGSMVTVVIWPG